MRLLALAWKYVRYGLLALVALAAGAVAMLTLTEAGRGSLASVASGLASAPGRQVRISGLDGIWSGHLTARQVLVEDSEGPWLALRDVEIDWSPLALLGLTFNADRVHAGRVELARLPEPAPQDGARGSSGLPVGVDIRSIDLPDIALGNALAGSVARLSAQGAVKAGGAPLAVDAKLRIDRTDGHEGNVVAQLSYRPDGGRLDLKLEGSEPAGGVVANLLHLPGQPAVAFSAEGSGPVSNWAGKASFSVDGAEAATLSARHQLTDAGSRIEASGSGAFAPFLPKSIAGIARGATDFQFRGTIGEGNALAIETAALRSQALDASASGHFNPNGISDLSLDARALGEPVALLIGEGSSQVALSLETAEVRLFGPGDALGVDARVQLASAGTVDHRAENVSLTVTSEAFDIGRQRGTFAVRADAAAAGSTNEMLASLLAGRVTLAGTADIDGTSIVFDAAEIRTGSATLSTNGSLARDTGVLSADVEAEMLSAVLPAAARAPLDRTVALSAHLERRENGTFAVSNLAARSGALELAGNATYGGALLAAELSGTLDDVARLSPKAEGALAFSAAVSGSASRPEVSIRVNSDRMLVAGRAIEDLKLDAEGIADAASPSGRFTLAGTVGGEPLTGQGTLAPNGGRPVINDLALSLGANKLEGRLAFDVAFLPEGTIEFNLPEIAPLAALGLVEADGAARGSLQLAAGDEPTATIDAQVDSFQFGDIAAGEIRITATARNYLSGPTVGGAIAAGRIINGKTEVRDVSVTLTQDGDWTGFDGRLQANGVPLTAKGRARTADAKTIIELFGASAELQGITAQLAEPTTVEIAGSTARLDDLTITAAGGTATVSGSAGQTLDLDVRLAELPAAALARFAPGMDPRGTLSGTAQITGTAAAPEVTYRASWKGGQIAQTRAAGFGAMDVTSAGTFVGDVLTFEARVDEGSGLGMSGGGSVNIASRTVDARLSGRVPFGFLAQRLAAQGVALSGGADVAFRVSGNLFKPDLSGTLKTAGARLVHAPSGLAVDDLAADVSLGGGAASIDSLSGTLSSGGTIRGSGRIAIDPAGGFPAELELTLDDGRYTDGRVVTANLDGKIGVSGPLTSSPLLSGTINLGRTVITIPERLPGSLAELDVQHRNAPQAVARQEEAMRPASGGNSGSGLVLDLQVNAPNEIIVQGRGLDAELGGSLKLSGPVSSPQAVGRFDLRRGRLDLLGRRLDFSSGSIGFSGSLVPYLDMAASSSVEGATVTVTVTGPATNPSFAFSSSPALPQDEILARLLFGKTMSGLSALQIAQLASAAGQLAGITGSTSLLQSLREGTGLDDIDVKTDAETGNTSLSVGKYLNDKTYLTIEKGAQPGSGKATIDLDMGRGIKLRGEASESGKTRGGIFYEKEY